MTKRITLLFIVLLASFASFGAISGTLSICVGSTTTLMDSASGGGTWFSSNPAVANITSSTPYFATISGVATGTATISYVYGTGMNTAVVSVNAAPSAIAGPSALCVGASTTYTNTTGGTWMSTSPCLSINVMTGVATGVCPTVSTVYFYSSSGCYVTKSVTVNSTASDSIMGASTVCAGSSISLTTSGAGGGTWSSSNPAVATVSGGVVSGLVGGTATISYSYTTSCGAGVATHIVTVTTSSSAGTISGPTSVAVGGSGSLSATVSGGVWSSSSPSIATISPSGVVTGVATGTAIISYAVSGCGPTVYATYTVTVTAPNGISGHVHYSGSASVKVWLIKYDPSTMMLSAVDSDYTYGLDSAYYEFLGIPTDSYRVKAALDSGTIMGFVPTYHTSSFYWNAATVINHVSGTWDAHKDINMIAGTPVSGPGFIGGSVITGANKGTTDGAAVPGMNVYLLNAATHAVIKHTTTDIAGEYSFSGLPTGIYDVYPEALSYATTPYASITLTTATPSMSTAKFMQRTISKKITPIGTLAVNGLDGNNTSISAFPNPTGGKLNINWEAASSEAAALIITDVTGREVLAKDFSMTKGSGSEVIDMSAFANGMYFISVKATSVSYVKKIEVRH